MKSGTIRQKAGTLELIDLANRVTVTETDITELESDAQQSVTVTLTTAQVLALNTTPIALVPAPWAGSYINVLSISGSVDYNSAAYATNTTLEFRYTDGSGTKVTADMAGLITATADKAVTVKGIEAELVNTQNAAVVVRAASGNPATGNSPVKFNVIYKVYTV